MFGIKRIKRLVEQNELLRGHLAKTIHENLRLKNEIKKLEMANDLLRGRTPPEKWVNMEVQGSELYQRFLHGSKFTKKWCEEQIEKEIARGFIEEARQHIFFTTNVVDDEHVMMTGKMVVSVKEVNK